MEFACPRLASALTGGGKLARGVSCWTSDTISALTAEQQSEFSAVLTKFGGASAAAQGLACPVTSLQKLVSSNHRLYVASEWRGDTLILYGGLKVGEKRLWLWLPGERAQQQAEPTCVLDFYVSETMQRGGYGSWLFREFLRAEGATPEALAYDHPSPKCLAFLAKHFGLHQPTHHPNNYVTFDGFGSATAATAEAQLRRQQLPPQLQQAAAAQWAASLSTRSLRACGREHAAAPYAPGQACCTSSCSATSYAVVATPPAAVAVPRAQARTACSARTGSPMHSRQSSTSMSCEAAWAPSLEVAHADSGTPVPRRQLAASSWVIAAAEGQERPAPVPARLHARLLRSRERGGSGAAACLDWGLAA